jgi:hypothetical protein
MPIENLTIFETGFEIAKAVKDFVHGEKPDHRLNDQICVALRTIYFTPNGVVALLKALEQNNDVTEEDLRDHLIDFNDREWKVSGALQGLNFDVLKRDLRLSLSTIKKLSLIKLGKLSLRHSIQREVNYYGRRGVRPNLDNIRSLIGAIEKLNAEIIEIEKIVNSRALER